MASSVFGAFGRDARAVSPVVGTILMVAITVMLAALLFAYVRGATGDLPLMPRWQEDTHTTTPPYNETGSQPSPGQPPSQEQKWSVEPMPGYDCAYQQFGLRDYLCTPAGVT